MRVPVPVPVLVPSLVAAALAAPLTAHAQTVVADPGTAYDAPDLTGFQTLGTMMGGMLVRADFSNGGFSDGVWGDLGAGVWGVRTLAFSLTMGGTSDTFSNPWTLGNTVIGAPLAITRLRLSGAPGGVVFDRATLGTGTVGSELGADFSFVGAGPGGTVATYRNLVGVSGAAPVGDVFEALDVLFGQGLAAGTSVQFIADTDNIPPGGRGIDPVVPEPSTYLMLGAGLATLGAAARRRARAAA